MCHFHLFQNIVDGRRSCSPTPFSLLQSAVLEGLKVEARARKKGKTGPLELYGGAADDEDGETGGDRGSKKKGGGPGVLPIGFGTGGWVGVRWGVIDWIGVGYEWIQGWPEQHYAPDPPPPPIQSNPHRGGVVVDAVAVPVDGDAVGLPQHRGAGHGQRRCVLRGRAVLSTQTEGEVLWGGVAHSFRLDNRLLSHPSTPSLPFLPSFTQASWGSSPRPSSRSAAAPRRGARRRAAAGPGPAWRRACGSTRWRPCRRRAPSRCVRACVRACVRPLPYRGRMAIHALSRRLSLATHTGWLGHGRL
jgi:hypothetical protein